VKIAISSRAVNIHLDALCAEKAFVNAQARNRNADRHLGCRVVCNPLNFARLSSGLQHATEKHRVGIVSGLAGRIVIPATACDGARGKQEEEAGATEKQAESMEQFQDLTSVTQEQ
jgi:hypothetical protein